MGFTITYKTLFEVKVIHHYFLNNGTQVFDNMLMVDKGHALKGYDVRNFLDIRPTPECERILSKYHCVYKNTPYGFIVGVQAYDNAGKSYSNFELNDSLKFGFVFSFRDIFFNHYTALPLVKDPATIYFLQNKKAGSPKQYPYLTRFPVKFSATAKYSAGDIVSDADTPAQLYIAKKMTDTTAPPNANWTADDLVAGKPLQYLTVADLLPVYQKNIRFNTQQTGLNLSIKLTNQDGTVVTAPFENLVESDKNVALVSIHHLPDDYYTLLLEDPGKPYSHSFSFYHLGEKEDIDGFINISTKSDENAYSIIAGDGALLSPVFELRFKNRSSLWKYMGEKFTNEPTSGPHPFTYKGVIDVTVKDKDNNNVDDMPNPHVRMIKTEHPVNNTQQYNVISEIHIN